MLTLEAALDHSAIGGLREAHEALSTARAAAELASGGAFADAPLGGMGSDAWKARWQAARRFAQEGADPAQTFPPKLATEAVCVLCQQTLAPDARTRMQRFEEFVRGQTRVQVDRAERELEERIQALENLAPQALADQVLLSEIEALDEKLAAILSDCTGDLTKRRDAVLKGVRGVVVTDEWSSFNYRSTPPRIRLACPISAEYARRVTFTAKQPMRLCACVYCTPIPKRNLHVSPNPCHS